MIWSDWVSAVLALLGGFFIFVAGLGVWRFKDIYMRMHAATKAGSLGLGFLLAAIAFQLPTPFVVIKSLLIIGFIFLTAPIAAHMISRASYLHDVPIWRKTRIDELKGKYSREKDTLEG